MQIIYACVDRDRVQTTVLSKSLVSLNWALGAIDNGALRAFFFIIDVCSILAYVVLIL